MREVKAAYGRGRPHGEAFGKPHARVLRGIDQLEEQFFLGVIRTGRIAGRRADAFVFLAHQGLVVKFFIGRITPELPAHAFVQPLGKGLGQTVRQRLGHDGVVIVVRLFEFLRQLLGAMNPDGETADIILEAGIFRRDEICERAIRPPRGFFVLLAQAVQHHDRLLARFILVNFDIIVVHAVGREQADHALRRK